VVDHDWAAVFAREHIAYWIPIPARHDRWRHRDAVAEADRSGHADADCTEPRERALRRELGEDLVDTSQDRLGSGTDGGRLAVGGQRLETPVGDFHVD